jgi:PKD repeat protein
MKNLFRTGLFVCFLCASAALQAQPVITQEDMAKVGDEVYVSTSLDNIELDSTGPDYLWDFSKMKPLANDTLRFNKPASIYNLLFYGDVAQVSNVLGQKGYSFYKSSKTSWVHEGMGFKMPVLNQDVPLRYSNTETIYQFPLTDSSRFSDSFDMNMSMQGLEIVIRGRRTTVVDGFGKIKTPYGTFECLRLKSEVIEKDTFIQGIDNSRTEYTWLAKKQKIPVLQVIVSNMGTIITYRDTARTVQNPAALKPEFMVRDTIVHTGDTVHFHNLTKTAGTVRYTWGIQPSGFTYVQGTNANSENPVVVFSKEGRYNVSLAAANPNGTKSVKKANYILVTSDRAPYVNFSASRYWANLGDSVVLTDLSNNSPTMWQWDIEPAGYEYLSSTTMNSQNPVVKFNEPGFYSVRLMATNSSGPGMLSRPEYIYITTSTAIRDENRLQVNIFPNPVHQKCEITTGLASQCTFQLFDMQGRAVQVQFSTRPGGLTEMDASGLTNGLYLLQIQSGNQRVIRKIDVRR